MSITVLTYISDVRELCPEDIFCFPAGIARPSDEVTNSEEMRTTVYVKVIYSPTIYI
jgi:hypothetical protein